MNLASAIPYGIFTLTMAQTSEPPHVDFGQLLLKFDQYAGDAAGLNSVFCGSIFPGGSANADIVKCVERERAAGHSFYATTGGSAVDSSLFHAIVHDKNDQEWMLYWDVTASSNLDQPPKRERCKRVHVDTTSRVPFTCERE